jgi:hypothetical protein
LDEDRLELPADEKSNEKVLDIEAMN